MSNQSQFTPHNISDKEQSKLNKLSNSFFHQKSSSDEINSEFTPHSVTSHDTHSAATTTTESDFTEFTPHNIPEAETLTIPDKIVFGATIIVSVINIILLISPFYLQPSSTDWIFTASVIAASLSAILYALTTYSYTNSIISSYKHSYYIAASLWNALNVLVFTFLFLPFIFILLAILTITSISSLTILAHKNKGL